MSTKVNIAVTWHLLCKQWLKSLCLINQSETSSNDAINDIYLIINFNPIVSGLTMFTWLFTLTKFTLNSATMLYLEPLETVTKSSWLSKQIKIWFFKTWVFLVSFARS